MLTSLTTSVTSVTRALGTLVVDVVVSSAAWFVPTDYREQCLGDLYEGHFRLRKHGRTKIVSLMITSWRVLTLIKAGLQMRLEDIHSIQQKHPQGIVGEKIKSTKTLFLMAILALLMPRAYSTFRTYSILLERLHQDNQALYNHLGTAQACLLMTGATHPVITGFMTHTSSHPVYAIAHASSLFPGNVEASAVVNRAIDLNQKGRVRYQGSTWNALCNDHQQILPVGTQVKIIGRKGNTLIVDSRARKTDNHAHGDTIHTTM